MVLRCDGRKSVTLSFFNKQSYDREIFIGFINISFSFGLLVISTKYCSWISRKSILVVAIALGVIRRSRLSWDLSELDSIISSCGTSPKSWKYQGCWIQGENYIGREYYWICYRKLSIFFWRRSIFEFWAKR